MSKEKAIDSLKKGMSELSNFLCDHKPNGARESYKYFQQALKELEEEK